MKMLLLILFLSSSAFGSSVLSVSPWKKVCYSDANRCFYLLKQGGRSTIYPDAAITPGTQAQLAMSRVGIDFRQFSSLRIKQIEASNPPVEFHTQAADQAFFGSLADIPDQEWDIFMNASGCGFAAVACVGGIAAAWETGGLLYFLAEAACVGTVPVCANALRSWEKYKRATERAPAEWSIIGMPEIGSPVDLPDSVHNVEGDSLHPKGQKGPCKMLPATVITSSEGDEWHNGPTEICH
jgi:hypothetical protein